MHPPGGHLRRHEAFQSKFLEQDRDVLVWLPPGYDDGSEREFTTPVRDDGSKQGFTTEVHDDGSRYPVLYMHDGQNLFEPDTAFQKGEHWRVGETATELIESGEIEPLIIVGIYNTGDHRKNEYTPTYDARLGGGAADDY